MATITESEVVTLGNEPDGLYEVVDGRVEEKPRGAYQVQVANLLSMLLNTFARGGGQGQAVAEMLFRLDATRPLDRRPDAAYVSAERWPLNRRAPDTAAWEVVPDLAVEVVSPTNRSLDDLARVDDYFHAGVRAVWFLYPTLGKAHVYRSPTSVAVPTRGDALDGGDVLPGFRVTLAELYGEDA
jgi:Uma2 family endonuclease